PFCRRKVPRRTRPALPSRPSKPPREITRSRARLTRNEGHGNATIPLEREPTHGRRRSAHERRFSEKQGAVGEDPPQLDEIPPHPIPSRRPFHLLRSRRSAAAHSDEAEGASPRLSHRNT